MIQFLRDTKGDLLVIKAGGRLTDADYKETLIPRLETARAAHGALRLVIYFARDFEGWDLASLWDDAKWGLAHRDDFAKIAVVGGPKWVAWGTRLDSLFMEGEVRVFAADRFEAAVAWARA